MGSGKLRKKVSDFGEKAKGMAMHELERAKKELARKEGQIQELQARLSNRWDTSGDRVARAH